MPSPSSSPATEPCRAHPVPWWVRARARLEALAADGQPRFVYHLPTIDGRARELREALPAIERFYYSMKANSHADVLRTVAARGLGIECVSAAEVAHARETLDTSVRLLFTPNFCPIGEYAAAFDASAEVVVDGPEPLLQRPATFRGRSVGLRIDIGRGAGHHRNVQTAGPRSKFGQPLEEIDAVLSAARRAGARVVGLHAHVGSGILDAEVWPATGRALATLLPGLGAVEWLDLGGGLGIPDRPGRPGLDLAALQLRLDALRRGLGPIELRLEPGRFLVAESGVLIAAVTQVRQKAGRSFVGLATGMNSLLRPALYGAWHEMHNLTRLDEPATQVYDVVGPLCESTDVLGRGRRLPATRPGDLLLIEQAGAYGAVMGCSFNMRPPAAECVLDG